MKEIKFWIRFKERKYNIEEGNKENMEKLKGRKYGNW